MRFLVLNYEYPPLGGGAGNATYFLCREWARMGIVTDIVTTWFPGLDQETCESALVTVHRVRSRRKKAAQSNAVEMLSYVAQGYLKARVLCERHAYDRVVSFFAIPCGMIALRLNQKLAIPYAVLLRGGDVPGFLPRELAFYHRLTMPLTRRIWRNADRVVANSRGLQELASVTGRRIGVTVDMVPNGVDTGFFSPSPVEKPAVFTFLFVGRFASQKNLLHLMDQFERLLSRHPARLVLVGDGPDGARLQERVRSSPRLFSSVTLFPWTTRDEVRQHYRNAHCLVNPSLCEGLPNTVLEAMACGLPVVATNVGGNNELVQHGANGFLFEVGDDNGLECQMCAVMSQPASVEMGLRSRAIAAERFSWESAARQLLPVDAWP
ncbi:MAG: hypothetical protein A3K19_00965 [Lentisphaerae bacterium RIFOXYB12_FULL_65_16]|nr:MAG: hypothetical protein A3K18_19010 [Lentisphaerae bacterium RIFOXYA12_64_32]OGV85576.1 MAG: hypothetical protein A3K19_00965 [Lentisphaerae bacterium RIFOXYB12_FULL_65_16]